MPHGKYKKMKIGMQFIFFFLITLCISSSASAQGGLAATNWPMFQHDLMHTGQSPFTGLTTKPLFSLITIIPCGAVEAGRNLIQASDGTIYVSSCGDLYAVNPENGNIIWTFTGQSTGYSTPAIAEDGTIYMGYEDNFVAITPNGQLKYILQHLDGNLVFGGSPVIGEDGSIYFVHDGIAAISADGNIKWSYPFNWWAHSSPAIGADGTIYVAGSPGGLYAFKPDGEIKWTFFVAHQDNSPSIGSDGTIYIGGYPATLYACNPAGEIQWSFATLESSSIEPQITDPPVIGSDGTIFLTANSYVTSAIYAITSDGALKWRFSVPWQGNQKDAVATPLVIDKDNNIFACSVNGWCFGIKADGTLLWESLVEPQGIFLSAPFISSDGEMLVFGGKGLYKFVPIRDTLYLPLAIRSTVP